ncbi:MAG: UDP-N-acetylmuramate dehydrogenase [bacterium]|nr:UDP-N-acetylmuramate dehydrogenase [bacterium]
MQTRLIQHNISLKEYSNIKIGGEARFFLDFKNLAELKTGLAEWNELKKNDPSILDRIFVISGATNILFDDAGFDGLILRNSILYIKKTGDDLLKVGAGTTVEELNNYCIENSLSGTEWSGGLPGSVGGAVFGNAGAFGGETKDSIVEVISLNIETGQIIRRNNAECQFDYRNSIFKSEKLPEVILSATIGFKSGQISEISRKIEDHIDYRKLKQPLEYPNIGSIFKNIDIKLADKQLIEKVRDKIKNDPFPVIPVAYLISLAGLKGKKVGGAMISEKHPNMFINTGGAKASDIKELIEIVRTELAEKFGVKLETEIRQLDKGG